MIKVLQIIPTLDQSGAEKQMTLLAAGLPRDEFEVHVAVLTRTGPLAHELEAANIPYTLIEKTSKIDLFAYFRLKKLIRKIKPDVVHTWLFAGNAYGRATAFACKVPVVFAGERCVDPWKGHGHFLIDRTLAKKSDAIITNSGGVADFYAKNGIPAGRFVVIPNAVSGFRLQASDFKKESPPGSLKLQVFEELGLQPARHIIAMVARLWPQKRIQEAIWAADMLKFAGEDFHFLIFGDGPQADELVRYRNSICINDRVHFLGHRSDVSSFMPHFDVLWCTSAYEGQSNSILEAMSFGVPVIASDIPGNRDLVVHDVTGFLTQEHGDDFRRRSRDLVKRTTQLFEDPAKCAELGRAAAERIAEHFTLEKMIAAHAELYSKTLAGKLSAR
ncbi:MAG: glycosyltransferase [Planctomycetaceae bacterium]|nr:glycosyltransferase [Planctomycetaceae bacterium]